MHKLERSYRRLLWAYPRFYRRHRGLEILTTLLDAAKPGQLRASRDEVFHLLASGLKCRLVPPGWAGKLAAGVVTLWVTLVLGGAGAYVAWMTQTGGQLDPSSPWMVSLSDTLVGQPATRVFQAEGGSPIEMAYSHRSRGDLQAFGGEGWAGARPVPDGYTRTYEQVGQAQTVLANARQRLQAEGWETGELVEPGVFWASHHGLLLRMRAANDGQSTVSMDFYPAEPVGVLRPVIIGALTGLTLTWPVMTWLTLRISLVPRRDKMLALFFGLPALYACTANTVDNVMSVVPDPATGDVVLAADLLYPFANQWVNPLAITVIALGLMLTVAVTTFTPWHRLARKGSAVAKS